jgi:hypothetical protein
MLSTESVSAKGGQGFAKHDIPGDSFFMAREVDEEHWIQ